MTLSKSDTLALFQNLPHTSLPANAVSIESFHNQGMFGLRLPLFFGQMATPTPHCLHNDAVIAKNEMPLCCRTTKVHHPKSTTVNLILLQNRKSRNVNCDSKRKESKQVTQKMPGNIAPMEKLLHPRHAFNDTAMRLFQQPSDLADTR